MKLAEIQKGIDEAKIEASRIQSGINAFQQGKAIISTQGVQKDILDPIREAIRPTVASSTPSSPIPPPTAEESLLKQEYDKQKTDAQKRADTDEANISSVLDPLKAKLDVNKQSQIDSIKSQYSLLRVQAEQANARRNRLQETIGVRFGGRFTPEHTADLVQDVVNQGISKIQELNAQEANSIATINSAFDEKSYTLAVKQFDVLKDIRKTRDDKLAEIEKTQREGLKKLQDANRLASLGSIVGNLVKQGKTAVDILTAVNTAGGNLNAKELKEMLDLFNAETPELKLIGEITKTAIENNATPAMVEAIQNSKTLSEAVKAGQGFLEKGTGDMAEALAIKRDMIARGLTALPIEELLTKVANQKAKVQQAINQAGLDKEQRTRLYALMDDYDKQTKDIKTVLTQSQNITALGTLSLSTNTDTGSRAAAQIGVIFSYMKMLDPTSTVREGEYATAQNTAGVPDQIRNVYNKVKDGSFLQDNQIKGYISTAEALAEVRRRNKKELDAEFDRRASFSGIPIGTIAGKDVTEEIVQTEQGAETSLKNYITANPTKGAEIESKISAMEKSLGKSISASDFLQAFPEYK